MTKDEAVQAMKDGHKVSHRSFVGGEWISLDGNRITTEESYSFPLKIFMRIRNGREWQTDWSIYDEV